VEGGLSVAEPDGPAGRDDIAGEKGEEGRGGEWSEESERRSDDEQRRLLYLQTEQEAHTEMQRSVVSIVDHAGEGRRGVKQRSQGESGDDARWAGHTASSGDSPSIHRCPPLLFSSLLPPSFVSSFSLHL